MAAPFKRLCCRAAPSARPSIRPQRHDVCQRPAFSHTPLLHRASPAHDDSPYLQSLPSEKSGTADPVYEDDDISSLGHAELDQHRELREMVRLAAWEMPQLAALHQPYDHHQHRAPLRWRYTTYMGEQHPAAHKVVVTFHPADLPTLTDAQRQKLLKLAGVRYNPVTGLVKMSCDSFPSQAQNKRYLASTIRALISESRDPNADSFADIPLDTRHVKVKPRPRFPEHWLVTEERRRELDERFRRGLREEAERVEANRVVSGVLAIEAAREVEVRRLEEPLLMEARAPLARGKMGRSELGQTRGSNRR